MTFKEKLSLHIKARYPVIWLTSYEEKRVERILHEIAKEQKNKRVVVWTATKGFVENGKTTSSATDLIEAFETVINESKKNNRTIYLFKDLHKFLPPDDTIVYRLVRDAAEEIKGSFATIIILSSTISYPSELEKTITVLDVPYPDADELKAVMDNVVQSAKRAEPKVKKPNESETETILRSAAGLTELEFENICAKSLIMNLRIDPDVVVLEKESTIRKSGLVDYFQSIDGLESVGGLDNLKSTIVRSSKAFSKKAQEFGLKPPRGFFLAGVTGCGKTLSVKAMASHMKISLLMADASRLYGKFVGESEKNFRAIFKLARAVAPCILFIDEAEKMLPQGTDGDSGVSSRTFGMLLTEMQECPPDKPVIFAMTANDPLRLPPELFNRFDYVFFVDLPTEEERVAIWKVLIKKEGKRDPKKFDLKKLAKNSDGWTGREIGKVINDALGYAFERDEDLTTEGILNVLKNRVPLSVQRKADIERMRSWGKDMAIPASNQVENGNKDRHLEF